MLHKPSEMLTFFGSYLWKWDAQLKFKKINAPSKAKWSQLIYKGTKICLPYALFKKLEFMVIQVLTITIFYIVIVNSVIYGVNYSARNFRCKVLGVFTLYLGVNTNLQM